MFDFNDLLQPTDGYLVVEDKGRRHAASCYPASRHFTSAARHKAGFSYHSALKLFYNVALNPLIEVVFSWSFSGCYFFNLLLLMRVS